MTDLSPFPLQIAMKRRLRLAMATIAFFARVAHVPGFVASQPGPPMLAHRCRHAPLTLHLNRPTPIQPVLHQYTLSPSGFVHRGVNCSLTVSRHEAFGISCSSSSSSSSSRGVVGAGPLGMRGVAGGNKNIKLNEGSAAQVCPESVVKLFPIQVPQQYTLWYSGVYTRRLAPRAA